MSEIIPIQSSVYNKQSFYKVIDTQFKELNTVPTTVEEITVDGLFSLYDDLFFDIPKEGDINSHRYILNRELEYFDLKTSDDDEIQALLQEITDLRQQLLEVETGKANLTGDI